MPRRITPDGSLDNFRKEAKRWLKALRAHYPDARAPLGRAHPAAPVNLDSLPGVTLAGTRVFPSRVRVSYST